MISINLLRDHPDWVRRAAERRGEDVPVDRILKVDARWRAGVDKADQLRARRKEVGKSLATMNPKPPELIKEMRGVGDRIKALDSETKAADDELRALLLAVPNLPQDDVPDGVDESDNAVIRTVGEPPAFSFEPLPHWDLGARLDIIDLPRGAKLSGSRFYILKGKGAGLQRALISWMVDLHVGEHGYEEIYPPFMVTSETARASGQLPKFANTMYHDDEDDLWMIPTAEVPLTNMYGGEILPPGALPLRYVAHTPSFRREKTAAGRDTRGIKRVHQFEKVEMYKFVEPETSDAELDGLVADASDVCGRLGVQYRVIQLSTGDLGFNSAKSFDLEMWAPGCEEWLEVSSCSNCTDFQARRSNIRYRPQAEASTRFPHTLNGSGLALPRVIIAVLENFQQADGSVIIPEVLRPYTGFDRIG